MSERGLQRSLESLLTHQKDFAAIVKHAVASTDEHAPRVDLLYVRFTEDTPDDHALAEIVCHQVINYAIPKRKLKALSASIQADGTDGSEWSKLVSEARRAFISYKADSSNGPQSRYSEIGEVIAFCIASHFLNSGQVAPKMALKTSNEMPVFGLDGIHASLGSDGILTVYFLESKMVGSAKDGGTQYAESAGGFETDRRHKLNEQRIARDLSNLDILEHAAKEAAIDYFNPYSAKRDRVRERFVGTIVYSEEIYGKGIPANDKTPATAHAEYFLAQFETRHSSISEDLSKALEKHGAECGKCRVFFLAVPSVPKLKELFAKEMSNGHIR